jgi:hypothetical protein
MLRTCDEQLLFCSESESELSVRNGDTQKDIDQRTGCAKHEPYINLAMCFCKVFSGANLTCRSFVFDWRNAQIRQLNGGNSCASRTYEHYFCMYTTL